MCVFLGVSFSSLLQTECYALRHRDRRKDSVDARSLSSRGSDGEANSRDSVQYRDWNRPTHEGLGLGGVVKQKRQGLSGQRARLRHGGLFNLRGASWADDDTRR